MPILEERPVAKKHDPPPKTDPKTWTQKPIIIQMRGSVAFKEWAEELAKHDRSTVAEMSERALIRYAALIGFTKEPPER